MESETELQPPLHFWPCLHPVQFSPSCDSSNRLLYANEPGSFHISLKLLWRMFPSMYRSFPIERQPTTPPSLVMPADDIPAVHPVHLDDGTTFEK